MKLRNKKTGEIIEAESCNNTGGCISIYYEEKGGQIGTKDCYSSLAELNEEWEDYEEPKDYCWIDIDGEVVQCTSIEDDTVKGMKEIGNYFETKEEAEKAVEKLKAWKRLKDKGFKFEFYSYGGSAVPLIEFTYESGAEKQDQFKKDIDLLFGGEE